MFMHKKVPEDVFQEMTSSVQATVTKCHRLGNLSNKHLFVKVLVARSLDLEPAWSSYG
jgi:hypothetical protein